ncbi:MAG: hypothetical protein V1735_07645 [Nanoarchaeota archaeon]
MKRIIIGLLVLLSVTVFGCSEQQAIGGDKDAQGCLVAAGYSWNDTIGACVRPWEVNGEKAEAARVAVLPLSFRPVTVVEVTEGNCPGCYDVMLQIENRTPTVTNVDLSKACGECPQYSPPAQGWCDGTVSAGIIDDCGCRGQPRCEIVGGDRDEHGCIGSAGYTWCKEKQKCIRPWEETCAETGGEHVCTAQESVAQACTLEYAPVCGKIVLNTGKSIYQTFGNGCSACATMKVVSYSPGDCPAAKIVEFCADLNGNYLTLDDAKAIAKASECSDKIITECRCTSGYRKEGDACNPECYYATPRCLAPSVQCEKTFVCNEGTGTYWINLNLTMQGCSPACVINLASNAAEINWRCTGLNQ